MYQSEMNTVNGINNEEMSLNPIEVKDKALVNDNNVEIPTIILNRNVTKSTNKMESKYACCFCDKIYKKKKVFDKERISVWTELSYEVEDIKDEKGQEFYYLSGHYRPLLRHEILKVRAGT